MTSSTDHSPDGPPKMGATIVPWSWYIFPTAAILAVYFPLLTFQTFIEIDDGGQIFENPFVLSLSWNNIRTIFTTSVIDMYQPMTSFLFAILVHVTGRVDPTVFRMASIFLHGINTCYLMSIANTVLQNPHRAFVLSMIFAMHPIHVETVSWISACSTLLSTTGFLLALNFYLQWHSQQQQHKNGCYTMNYWSSVLWYGFGGLAKVTMVPLVGILWMWDVIQIYNNKKPSIIQKKDWQRTIVTKIPFLIIASILMSIAYHFRGGKDGFPGYDYNPMVLLPAQLLWYPTKILYPVNLGILYDWPSTPWTIMNICGYAVLLVLGSIFTVLLFSRRQLQPSSVTVAFGILWYLAMISLHTALVTKLLAPYADRYAYVSSIGIMLALIGSMTQRQFETCFRWMMILILVYGILAHRQDYTWKNTMSVWSQNILHENASFSYGMRGAIHYKNGNQEEALRDFLKVAESPDTRLDHAKYAYLFNALGVMTADTDPNQALEYFLRVLQFDPSTDAFLNLAKMLLRMERYADVERILMELLERDDSPRMTILELLTNLYFQSERLERIPPILTLMIQMDPQNALLYQKRSLILHRLGDMESSKKDLVHANELLLQQK